MHEANSKTAVSSRRAATFMRWDDADRAGQPMRPPAREPRRRKSTSAHVTPQLHAGLNSGRRPESIAAKISGVTLLVRRQQVWAPNACMQAAFAPFRLTL